MSKREVKDVAASVHQRLLNIAHERHENFEMVLRNYGRARLLRRLEKSEYDGAFILKGATLFSVWSDEPYRPTMDLDVLARGDNSVETVEKIFRELCKVHVEDDGLVFDSSSVQGEQIRDEDKYQGVRIKLRAKLRKSIIPLQIDVAFGDAIVPSPQTVDVSSVLDNLPPARVLAYPPETVVAEKFQILVSLGIGNSRMKDYYDLWTLARTFSFEGATLSKSIKATFDRRETPVPDAPPIGLTQDFTDDAAKRTQWNAFLRKGDVWFDELTLTEVVDVLNFFLMPPARAVAQGEAFEKDWSPGGPWKNRD